MHEIFISYRHDDAAGSAAMLRDALVSRFGVERVYLDKDTQRPGDWKEQIKAGLAGSKVVLVLIGPRWLEARTRDGRRRLELPDDVHRLEVAQALSMMPAITVIPVLLDRADLPAAEDLSADLQPLVAQQARPYAFGAEQRDFDAARLVSDIEQVTGLVARKAKPTCTRLQWTVLLLAAFIVTFVVLTSADTAMGMRQLGFGEKLLVFLVGLAVLALGRWLMQRGR